MPDNRVNPLLLIADYCDDLTISIGSCADRQLSIPPMSFESVYLMGRMSAMQQVASDLLRLLYTGGFKGGDSNG